MQNRTAKSLGAAVLGVAFAATAVGTASAVGPTAPVPAGLPVAGGPLTAVTGVLPAADKLAPGNISGADPVSGLLGGLPTKALPLKALPTKALPNKVLPTKVLPLKTLTGGISG